MFRFSFRRLYWTDLKLRTIESLHLEGRLRKTVKKFHPKEGKPDRIDVFESFVYFTTHQHHRVMKMNKFGRGNVTEVAEEVTRVSDIVMMHKVKHLPLPIGVENPCSKNGPCSGHHSAFCLIVPVDNYSRITSKCECPDNFVRDEASGNCLPDSKKQTTSMTTVNSCGTLNCNNGKCVEDKHGGNARCECDPLYDGPTCDHFICAGYCWNGGICFNVHQMLASAIGVRIDDDKLKQVRCTCRKGFTGERCEVSTTDCSSMCSNNATCSVSAVGNKITCNCQPGFKGKAQP